MGPVLFVDGKMDDIRWRVTLREKDSAAVIHVHVTAQLLKLMKLNSVWRNGTQIGDFRVLKEYEFQIVPESEKTIWRKSVEGRKKEIFTYHRTEENYVPYSLFKGVCSGTIINVLLRQSGTIRFYAGRSPQLSKHFFDFTAPDKNPRLFKCIFQHPVNEFVTVAAFTNGFLRRLDKREIAKFVSDSYGSHQISRCAAKARVAHNNGFPVWPSLKIPHDFASTMKVIGQTGLLSLEDTEGTVSLNVLAVTEILSDDFTPTMKELHEIAPSTVSTGDGTRKTVKIVPEEFPLNPVVDVGEESGADWDVLYEIEDDSEDEIVGSSQIRILQKRIELADIPAGSLITLIGKVGEKSSTTRSGGGDPDTGKVELAGSDNVIKQFDKNVEPEDEPILDPLRPKLLDCDPQYLIDGKTIEFVPRTDVPIIFGFLVDGILGASKLHDNSRQYRFYGDEGRLPSDARIPLITLNKGLGDTVLMPTCPNGLRRAVIAEVRTAFGVTYYMDIERHAEKKESVGINCISFPGRTSVSSSILAYILEHRICPSVGEGSWPDAISHKGPFHQIVRKHVAYKKSKQIAGLKLAERQKQHELKMR